MTPVPSEAIYRDLEAVVVETFPDRDVSVEVGPETRAFADLGLTSIELIVLGERLEQFYGRQLPFGPFLADLRNRGVEDLELGDLVAFLAGHVA